MQTNKIQLLSACCHGCAKYQQNTCPGHARGGSPDDCAGHVPAPEFQEGGN